MVMHQPDHHPHHPHHLECPDCGRHTVVTQGESRYACLNCHWRRDIAEDWGGGFVPITVLAGLLLLLFL
jgi:ribosomal protein L37AE/L43A